MIGNKVFKTNVEWVFIANAKVEWALITGNIMHSFHSAKLVWEEVTEIPKGSISNRDGLHWMVRDSLVRFVRRQVGGHAAETRGMPILEGRLRHYNVVIDDVIYRILLFKADVGYYKPTFVFVLEDTGLRESDTPDERRQKTHGS